MKNKLLIMISVLMAITLHAQEEVYRVYQSQNIYNRYTYKEFQKNLESELKNSSADMLRNDTISLAIQIIDGANSIIDKNAIKDQLKTLNNYLNKKNPKEFSTNVKAIKSFYDVAENPNVYLCAEPTIKYVTSAKVFDGNDIEIKELLATAPPINARNTINIYVINMTNDNGGFATMPSTNAGFQGIVINKKYFGKHKENKAIYNQGKTLVHLLANFLGVYELWNEYEYCADDLVADTPIHNYANFSYGPDLYNVSTCDGNPTEMIVNFMDNMPDEYTTMFTKGQVERMKKMLAMPSGRASYVVKNCQTAGLRSVTKGKEYSIYPNPLTNTLYIYPSADVEEIKVELMTAYGVAISERTYRNVSKEQGIVIDVSGYTPGLYYAKMQVKKEEDQTLKFIKL
jgi:hypothetical protein